MLLDIIILISITQQLDLQFGTQIIIQRQPGTISQFITGRIESNFSNQLSFHISGTLGTGWPVAGRGSYLIVHTLGIEIITVFHHLMQHLIHCMETGTDGKSISRTRFYGRIHPFVENTYILQFCQKSIHKDVLTGKYQWRQHRIVIIPAPSFAQQISILHRTVCINTATDGVDAHLLQPIGKGCHIIAVKTGIHATDTINIAG